MMDRPFLQHIIEYMADSGMVDVIDIVRVRDGRYAEHWGMNNLAGVVAAIRGSVV